MTQRVNSAIERSVSHNKLVRIDADQADIAELSACCDDSVEVPADDGLCEVEYWGTDDDGASWRVHARPVA